MAKITAVIDIGSNSARMAIFEKSSRFGFHLLKEIKSKVRISEDTYQNGGKIQVVPMDRAFNALREFLNIAKSLKARKILCVATSALRDAPNRHELLSKVEKDLKLSIKVIDGEKEAFFGAVAAINLLPIKDGITVDIGGGSTEFAYIQNGHIHSLFSLNIGTIRLKEIFFDTKKTIKEAEAFVLKEFSKLPQNLKVNSIIGIGGTIRALSKSIMKRDGYYLDYVHGYEFDAIKELDYFDKIINSTTLKLKKLPIKEERFDTIREGALIFLLAIKHFEAKKIVTSGVGVREGVFLSDMLRSNNYRFPNDFNPSIKSLIDRFCTNEKSINFNKNISLLLFDILSPIHNIDKNFKTHLGVASKLSGIGLSLGYYDNYKHSAYFVENNLTYGFTHSDKLLISTIIRVNNKKVECDLSNQDIVIWLSFIMALSQIINIDLSNPKVSIVLEKDVLYIYSSEKLYLASEAIKKINKPYPFAIIFEKISENRYC